MRSLVLGGSVALAIFSLLACEDDGGGPNGFSPSGPSLADGGPDAMSPSLDATPEAAAPNAKVTVTVLAGTDPVAGAPVVAHDPTGAMLSPVVRTGADGKVVIDAVESGFVTIGTGGPGRGERRVFTYVGVKNGDDLLVREQKIYPAVQVAVPGTSFPTAFNVGYVIMIGGCEVRNALGAGGVAVPPPATVTITPTSDCRGPGPFALFGTSFLFNAGELSGTWLGSVAADATQATLPAWQSAPATPAFNTPNFVTTNDGNASSSASVTAIANGFATRVIACTSTVGSSEHACRSVSDVPDAYQAQLKSNLLDVTTAPPVSLAASFVRRLPVASTITIDEAAPTAPATSAFALDRTVASRPVLSWKSPLAGAAGAIAELRWNDQTPEAPARARWVFVLPPSGSATPISAPSLPPELAEGLAPAGTSFSATIEVIESDLVADYNALRKSAADWHRFDGDLMLPTNGTARTMRAAIAF